MGGDGAGGRTSGTLPCLPEVRPLLRQAWGDWLGSQHWDYFLTITFREPVPFKRQESVVHAAGQVVMHRYAYDRLFLCAEPHLSYDTHLHGLVNCGTDHPGILASTRQDLWRCLFDKFGRSSVECPRGPTAVTRYVSKYCVKGTGYYELWGPSLGSADPNRTLPGGYVRLDEIPLDVSAPSGATRRSLGN